MAPIVQHLMARDPVVIPADMDAFDAAGIMLRHGIGAIPVVSDDGTLFGIVTDRDLIVRVLGTRSDPAAVRMADVATSRELVTVAPDASLHDALGLMAAHKVRRLPVVRGDRLVGVVSMGDLANSVASKRAVGEAVAEVLESPTTTTVDPRPHA